jgi:hypothetical protein
VKNFTSFFAGSLLAIALSVTVVAQEPIPPSGVTTDTDNGAVTTTTTPRANDNFNDDVGFNPGWLGLLGLIGLAGLMPRDRRERHVHNVGATTTRTV